MKNFKEHLINENKTVLDALKKLNEVSAEALTLFAVDGAGVVKGAVTDGDIRRALIKGKSLNFKIGEVAKKKFYAVTPADKNHVEKIRKIRTETSVNLLPVLDAKGKIKRLVDFTKRKNILPVDAVLMAGGKGMRLRPLTDNLPKPLINVGGQTIIDRNICRLEGCGIENIYISINYMAEKMEKHFKDNPVEAKIRFIREKESLGTLGAAGLVKNYENDVVLVMNSDLFTNIDFEYFYEKFITSGADMSVATVPYNMDVPYGIMELEDGEIKSFKEKPSYTHFANAGIYLIKTAALRKYLPKGKIDSTEFVELLISKNKKVVSYPISGYWIDIGRPEDLEKIKALAQHINRE